MPFPSGSHETGWRLTDSRADSRRITAEMVALYNAGTTVADIAARFGVSDTAVRARVRGAGYVIRRQMVQRGAP